jgi:CPA1 family monovalent cation:H+ antiporter
MTDVASIVRTLTILLLIALMVILITRRFSVPYTLGLVVVGLLISFASPLLNVDFRLTPDVVLFVFLPALIFEGAWAISIEQLRKNWLMIFFLVGPGLLLELMLIALPLHFFIGLNWNMALLLAAILSPTDPVAVLGLFRQLHVNAQLAAIIEGESLLNDGIAGSFYQVFLAFALAATTHQAPSGLSAWLQGLGIFFVQVGCGVGLGIIVGFAVSRFVSRLDAPLIETTLTVVAAYGAYLLADAIHASGILAVVATGLIVGSYGRSIGMSEHTQETVETFWDLIAFIANALLFLLVGVQLNPLRFIIDPNAPALLFAAGTTIVLVLLARLSIVFLLPASTYSVPTVRLSSWRLVIFWSGLRGALSLALVLALPFSISERNMLVFATYAVILFTLLVQGFSISTLLKLLPSVRGERPTV